MSKKTLAWLLIVVGVLVLGAFLLADVLGIGRDTSVVGPVQIFGAVAGLLIAVVGAWLARGKARS